MFVWLASYPKSGNTLVRSLLASYFFSEDGNYDFEQLKNINQFPDTALFKKFNIDLTNEENVIKNYIKVQEFINKKKQIQFLKTHSYLFNIKNNPFTNLENTLGAIYMVRDPRNIVLSLSNHNQKSHHETVEDMVQGRIIGKKKGTNALVYTGNWKDNFNSWKSFKTINKYLLIKYEDLINDKEKYFYIILEFIYSLKKIDFNLNKKKFQNVIDSTSFKKMQKLESEKGFDESTVNPKTGEKVKFFNLGEKTNWKNSLDINLTNKVESFFSKEMIELKYL